MKRKEWIVVIILALIAAIIFVGRYLVVGWYQIKSGVPFDFFSFTHPDPLVNLAPMFREVYDGTLLISDGRTLEHIGAPALWSALAPIVSVPLLYLFKSVSLQFLVGTFLSAAATFVVIYLIAKHLTNSKIWSALFSFILTNASLLFVYLVPTSISNVKTAIRGITPFGSPAGEILMSRYVSISVFPTLPVFAFAIYSVFKMLTNKRSQVWFYVSSVTNSLLIYLYITDAIYVFAALGISWIFFLVQKKKLHASRVFRSVLLSMSLAIPYWMNYAAIQALPHSSEFYRRVGGEITHAFRWSAWPTYLAYGILAWLVWLWGRKYRHKVDSIFISSLVLAGIAVLNIQVLIGFNPAPSVWPNHQTYFGLALAFLVLLYWLLRSNIWGKYKIYVSGFMIVVALSTVGRATYTEFVTGKTLIPGSIMPSDIRASMDWIETELPVGSVVATPSLVTNALLPVHTGAHSVLPVAVTSPTSLSEIRDRWLVVSKLFDVERGQAETSLRRQNGFIDQYAQVQEDALNIFLYDSYFFPNTLDAFFEGRKLHIPGDEIEKLLAEYDSYTTDFDELLGMGYRIDYLYIGPYERRLEVTDFSQFERFERVYEDDGVEIYKVLSNG